ncbi:hypothetical protein BOX15_Mlig027914g1, partial [Macrostomum lignano]
LSTMELGAYRQPLQQQPHRRAGRPSSRSNDRTDHRDSDTELEDVDNADDVEDEDADSEKDSRRRPSASSARRRSQNQQQQQRRSPSERSQRSAYSAASSTTTAAAAAAVRASPDRVANPAEVRRVLDRLMARLDSERALRRAAQAESAELRQQQQLLQKAGSNAELVNRLQKELKVARYANRELRDRLGAGQSLEGREAALAGELGALRRHLAAAVDAADEDGDGEWESAQRTLNALTKAIEKFVNKRWLERDQLVHELQTELDRLKTDYANLSERSDQASQAAEERVKSLKKRNAELAAIARRLEEKARSAQQPSLDEIRRDYERRRMRDLAENAKLLSEKDNELAGLRHRVDQLNYKTRNNPNSEALEGMLKTAQRERLLLERQLTWNQDLLSDEVPASERLKLLTEEAAQVEQSKRDLEAELEQLREEARQANYLESSLAALSGENEQLKSQLQEEHTAQTDLENNLSELRELNTELSVKNSDLQTQLQDAEQVKQINQELTLSLQEVGTDLAVSRQEADFLRLQMAEMELIMKHMRESLEKKRELESEHARLKHLIDEKSRESFYMKKGPDNYAARANEETVDSLKTQLRELEKRAELQSLRHEELMLELEAAKKKQKYDELRGLGVAPMQQQPPQHNSTPTVVGPDYMASSNGFQPQDYFPSSTHNPGHHSGGGGADYHHRRTSPQLHSAPQPPPPVQHHSSMGYGGPTASRAQPHHSMQHSNSAHYSLSQAALQSYPKSDPGKRAFVAKYSYDPYSCSPNDRPRMS